MESPHALTKVLLPSKRGNLLHRPRLVNFLHEHIERKLLLVSASAGYGKTALLIDFAHEATLPVCWYSLDGSDHDPKVFLEYVIAALRRQFPDFGARTLGLLANATALRDLEVLVGTLVTEIYESIPTYFALVLDDYHLVEESNAINRLLDTFLRLQPENAHLILASRTLPTRLTLTRLAARQEIAGLGVNDLRFTADEIRALVQQNYRIELTDAQALELAEQSEGWITGIVLTTQTLWQGLFQDLVRLQGPHSQVFNYLASEVFALQPPALQRFLLDTSIFDQLAPSVCDELLDIHAAAAILNEIEQKNLFITRLEEGWYRYHHLFKEFLQMTLRASDATRWRDLNRRAGNLFQARGVWDQAIAHYLNAHLFDDAARALEPIAKEMFESGHWATLTRWIDALPSETQEAYPSLLVTRAMVLAEMGNSNLAAQILTRAFEVYSARNDTLGMARALVKRAVCWHFQGRYPEAIENCQRALEFLGEEMTTDGAEAHRIIGASYGLMGDWTQAIGELERALQMYQRLDDLPRVARLHHDLGVAHRTTGSPAAPGHFQQALDYWQRANQSAGLANTLNSIGVGLHQAGEWARAIEVLTQAREQTRQAGQLRIEAFTLASLGDVYRDLGQYAQAQETYQSAFEIARRINEGFILTYTLTALGETFRLTGDLAMASQLIRQAVEQARSHRSHYELGLTETALGILLYEQGDWTGAADHLSHAIDLLAQGGAKRDAARAHLHLARVELVQRKPRETEQHLKVAAEIGRQLGEYQFIFADRAQLAPVIEYAVTHKVGDSYFARAQDKLNSLAPAAADSEQVAPTPAPRFEARALGTATVFKDDRQVAATEWNATTQELFFFLLAHPAGLRKEQILSALWGDLPPARANGIFHSTIYRLRRALSPECVLYENNLYRVNLSNLWNDVDEFKRLVSAAQRASTPAEQAQHHREAIQLYRGDYFEDSYSDWCMPIRADLQHKYLAALWSLARYHDERGDSTEAIALYRKILEKDNYREDVYCALMNLQFRMGDRTGALKTFQQCDRILREEMNLAPGPAIRELYRRIVGETNDDKT